MSMENIIVLPEEEFIHQLSALAHEYLLKCRENSMNPNPALVPILIGIMEYDLTELRDIESGDD